MRVNIRCLAFFSSLSAIVGSASVPAQSAPVNPPKSPITAEMHAAGTRNGTIRNGGKTASASAVVGWNYMHATNCNTYFDGVTNWVYVYPVEGGFWFTSDPYFMSALQAQCVLGNWIALWVFNPVGGLFNQVFSYDYK